MFPCKMLRRKPDKIFLKVFSLVSPPSPPPRPVHSGQLLLLLLHEELQVDVIVRVAALPSTAPVWRDNTRLFAARAGEE